MAMDRAIGWLWVLVAALALVAYRVAWWAARWVAVPASFFEDQSSG